MLEQSEYYEYNENDDDHQFQMKNFFIQPDISAKHSRGVILQIEQWI